MEVVALLTMFMLGLAGPAVLRRLASECPMTPALARLSAAVDRVVALVNTSTTDAQIDALTDKLNAVAPPPPPPPVEPPAAL